jgi:energy-coupling factor transport system ATP-binding protein
MESLGVSPAVMRRRVEETLDLLGLADLRDRPLLTLSAGQQQRVAIGAVLTAHPHVLVLDEPTSALDPQAAEEVLASLHRLVGDLGMTVLLAEHRLERVVQFADQVVLLPARGARPLVGPPAQIMRVSPVVPPLVALARVAGWEPVPLSVRDARARDAGLRSRLPAVPPPAVRAGRPGDDVMAELGEVTASYAPPPARAALRAVSLAVRAGEVVALMGRNGSGKTTLLRVLVGLMRPQAGQARLAGQDPTRLADTDRAAQVAMVCAVPGDILYAETVGQECATSDRDRGVPPGSTRALLDRLIGPVPEQTHPRDLSEGQRLGLALAVMLVGAPRLLVLDEPTRGLDYQAKARLVDVLADHAAAGGAVVLATHDVELAAEVATRVVVLADGEVVADGATADVVVGSPAFAPQVAKVLAPVPWLTVAQGRAALGAPKVAV